MKITMIALGSTGDVRPYMLLGRELRRRGHDITIASFASFQSMVEDAGLRFQPLAGDVVAIMANLMKPGAKGVSYLWQVEKSIRDIAPAVLEDLTRACADADAMLCTYFGSLYYSIAEKYRIPCIQTHYYPMDPTTSRPFPLPRGRSGGRRGTRHPIGWATCSSACWKSAT